MGEIRIVGPGKTRGYPYPVCRKRESFDVRNRERVCLLEVTMKAILLV